jgi:chromosomal replication initiation ATPase DnaA
MNATIFAGLPYDTRAIMGKNPNNLMNVYRRCMYVLKEHYDISEDEICSKRRFKALVKLRAMCYKIIRDNASNNSFANIGRLFNRDHATILFGIKSLNNHIDIYKVEAEEYETFKRLVL